MATVNIVTGDDLEIPVSLLKNNTAFSIDASATVTAMIVSTDHLYTKSDSVIQSDTTPGADWAESLVVVTMSSHITGAVTGYGSALLEIQVDDDGRKRTWFVPVTIIKGNIL